MKNNIDEVVKSGIQTKQLTIRHVRKPGQRMPVRLVKGGKSPSYVVETQTCADVDVLGDVRAVVVIKEFMTYDGNIQQQADGYEQDAKCYGLLVHIREQVLRWGALASSMRKLPSSAEDACNAARF